MLSTLIGLGSSKVASDSSRNGSDPFLFLLWRRPLCDRSATVSESEATPDACEAESVVIANQLKSAL